MPKKYLKLSALIISAFLLLTPSFAFAYLQDPCKSDADCTGTPDAICDNAYKLCALRCKADKECSSKACDIKTGQCKGGGIECPSGETFDFPTGKCLTPSMKAAKEAKEAKETPPEPTPPPAPAEKPFVPVEPTLQIEIPTLQFSKITREGQIINVPFLADYIAGVYKYAVGIVSLVAIIMIMVGGLRYLTAGGNASSVGAAKEMISGAIIGLFLVLGSYLVLYTVNPDLVSFKNLQVKLIERQEYEFVDKGDVCEGISTIIKPKKISNTDYDAIFQKYGTSAGVDWKILKAIAYKESSLTPTLINPSSGAAGLFQIMGKCKKEEARLPIEQVSATCKQYLDADYNTQKGADMIKKGIAGAKQACPNANQQVLFTLVYMAHNSGGGAVQCATKTTCKIETAEKTFTPETTNGGCSLEQIKQGIETFWSKNYKKKYARADRGPFTYTYSVSTANLIIGLMGGSASGGGDSSPCPAKSPAANTSGVKILAVGDSITAAGGSWAYKLKNAGYTVDVIAKVGEQTGWMWQQITNKDLAGYTHVIVLGGINDIYSGTSASATQSNLTKIYQKAKAAGAKVIAITIPPSKGYKTWTQSIQTKTTALNSWLSSQGDNRVDFYSLIKDSNDSAQQSSIYASSDHLHPNAAAHQVLANAIIPYLSK